MKNHTSQDCKRCGADLTLWDGVNCKACEEAGPPRETYCEVCGKPMGEFPISVVCSKTCNLKCVQAEPVVNLKTVQVIRQSMRRRA